MSDSDILASYEFLSWYREGIGTALPASSGSVSPAGLDDALNASFPVTLNVKRTNGIDSDETVSVDVHVYGPGDVTGISRRQVIRTEPSHMTMNFEPNYFPTIELGRPDLPWLFTPTGPDASDKLMPWITLIVVEKQEGVSLKPTSRRPLPVLELKAPADPARELPDLREAWAWAHVQVTSRPGSGESAMDVIAGDPKRSLARLACARRLEPNKSYYACVVPTFQAGVQAGLGIEVDISAKLDFAWPATSMPPQIQLPVYYHWEFSTGAVGDFEALVRMLVPRPVPPEVGRRPMDVSRLGFGIDPSPGTILPLESVLMPPDAETEPWAETARQEQLRAVLNAAESLEDENGIPVVAPPIYGKWYIQRETVAPPGDPPRWLGALNLDPRNRAAAGFGTIVIQENQEALMHSAWEQIGEVLRANQLLKQAQFGRAVSQLLYRKHVATLSAESILNVTTPFHARLRLSPHTLYHQLQHSRIPAGVASPAFRRIVRPRGVLMRRVFGRDVRRAQPFLSRLNEGDLIVVPPAAPPDGTVTMDDVSDAVQPAGLPDFLQNRLNDVRRILYVTAAILLVLWLLSVLLLILPLVVALTALLGVVAFAIRRLQTLAAQQAISEVGRPETFTPDRVLTAPGNSDFAVVDADAPFTSQEPPHGEDNEEARRFRAAAVAQLESIYAALDFVDSPPNPPLPLEEVRTTLLARLRPEQTIVARVLPRIRTVGRAWEPDDPITPIVVGPEFPQPMYEPLRDHSQELMLAGLEAVPPNTITLLKTNNRFIESYMVGLNHEMGRELRWNEYPDNRGTYFRQFWDISGLVPPPRTDAERETLKDLRPIHTFPSHSKTLGENMRVPEDSLVLLVRGELLRRYPNTIVFAVPAVWNDIDPAEAEGNLVVNGKIREPKSKPAESEILTPLFQGSLDPDVRFYGFDLAYDEALGDVDDNGEPHPDLPNAGVFIVLQEQPSEVRLALDVPGDSVPFPPTDVDEVSWDHVIAGDLNTISYAPINDRLFGRQLSLARWGENAAHMAYITLQQPVLIAIHADDMLPPKG